MIVMIVKIKIIFYMFVGYSNIENIVDVVRQCYIERKFRKTVVES